MITSYLDGDGVERAEVTGAWALEAARVLLRGGVHPRSLEQGMAPLLLAAPPGGVADVAALRMAAEQLAQDGAASEFLRGCVAAVHTPREVSAFHHHMGAVMRVLAVIEALVAPRKH